MGRSNDNIMKANKIGYTKTYSQLKSWGVNLINFFYLNLVLMYMWMTESLS